MVEGTEPGTGEETATRRAVDGVLDLARKAVGTSVKSLLNTEEGLRQVLSVVVPKEVGQAVRSELGELRREFLEALVREVNRFLAHVDPAAEMQRLLANLVFDIHVRVGISRKDPSEPAVPEAAGASPRRSPRAVKGRPRTSAKRKAR